MSRKARSVSGPRGFLLNLPSELSLDLDAFCEAHYASQKTRVILEAIRQFIDEDLKADEQVRRRFEQARRRRENLPLQIVRSGKGK